MKTVLTFLSALLLFAAPGWAVLGESVESVRADQQALEGRLRTEVLPEFSIHHISRDDGTLIKEFVSPQGKVFGLTWEGPTMPNLSQLLGSYFQEFQRSAQSSTHRRGPLVVRTDQLVLESGGHMRAFRGRAYLLKLLPNNVSQGVVR